MVKTNGFEEQLTLLQNEGLKIEKWLKEANVADECIGATFKKKGPLMGPKGDVLHVHIISPIQLTPHYFIYVRRIIL